MLKQSFLFFLLLFWLSVGCTQQNESPISPLILQPPSAEAFAQLATLTHLEVSPRDLVSLTRQFKGIAEIPPVAQTKPTPYQVGDVATFWIKNHDSNINEQIEARLHYYSDDLLFWVQIGERVDDQTVQQAVKRLEEQIFPRNRATFGMEWQPGVDGETALHILHSSQLGSSVIGYFAAADEFVTEVNPFSNERELLYINLKNAPIGQDVYYEVVAHEMVHLIHWGQDQNEATWVEEGLAELGAYLNGYNQTDYETAFAKYPDVQLTNFSQFDGLSEAHYGAAFLFMSYFYDQFGEEGVQKLIQNPQNGVSGFVSLLPNGFEPFFADWVVATVLGEYPAAVGLNIAASPLKEKEEQGQVFQFGTDFLTVEGEETVTLVFTGTQQVGFVPALPHSGNYYWSTYPADNANMTLTRSFDLHQLDQANLSFWSWYEIEAGWDYAYVVVSTDEGETWTPLETVYTTHANPQGYSYGAALTGLSGSAQTATWVEQTADLTPYVGQTVQIRFQYITDSAVHLAGFALDDLAIPQLDYHEDFENGDGGWQADGFVRHNNQLPQFFLAQLILLGEDGFQVERLIVDEKQQGQWQIPLNQKWNRAIIAISGVTSVTSLPASYQYHLKMEQ